MKRKAMRPKNIDYKKLPYPLWLQPKLDGVRALNFTGRLTARTLKEHRNRHITAQFSKPEYIGFDGEIAAWEETHWDLCRKTSSACSTEAGEPYVWWHVFDFVTEQTVNMPYYERYRYLKERIEYGQACGQYQNIRLVPYVVVNNYEELQVQHNIYLSKGYEGSVAYNPNGLHKEGNCSPINGPVWRIKDFIDFEAEIIGFTEGEENLNEAQINELGLQYRSSHKENKVPNGMIGNLQCKALQDVYDLQDETRLLIPKDSVFTAAPGFMDHSDRTRYFNNPELIIDQVGKFKFFPKGLKDKPRFPQFVTLRSLEDL